jgi:hypothetical protein
MRQAAKACALAICLILTFAASAKADTIDGVITSYDSGNKGTDVMVKTTAGRSLRLWFDNMKKPVFQGKELPWCPGFPCDGWPKQLVFNKTRVRIHTVKQTIEGETIQTPTRIELLH